MARDFTGARFGKLVVTEQLGLRRFRKGSAFYVRCRCDCGETIDIQQSNLLRRRGAPSCGCARPKRATGGKGSTKHPLFRVWTAMVERCTLPSSKSYPDYGGRGITVCTRWMTGDGVRSGFECFVADMPPRPEGGMIERKDNERGYGPENCTWADRATQNANKRSNRMIEIDGERLTVAEWARRFGRSEFLIYRRLDRGWEPTQAVLEPPRR